MTLSVHSVVGAGLSVLARANPLTAFVMGLFSHFVLDAIPHWDYPLKSGSGGRSAPMYEDMVIGRDFVFDLLKIIADALLGITLVMFVFKPEFRSLADILTSGIFWGVVGGMLPDFLQFLYFKIKKEPLIAFQHFHTWIHEKEKKLNDRNIIGPALQIALIIFCIYLVPLSL
ncbi:MAG: hypothetical protein A2741_02765 [Candidatus Zambryskibacteria bacterium RIFCSPHIGHO2_01_FULL_43_27]|uniref:Uncharacterized protein n=1 Tax=Candidatus Zambryskibacteria bacterium RIFCSPLOWO2_01_FULL_43_17 TaxID=1802760 RepID=A0A1G2U0K0_9BACT|nr:MAG: hypothetical protein A2741_02765 [Candidatus Zambryskibacteria bacterium RIFCSPHIGHO2_01_FULL_43_27]OHB00579.1 MAG: hypothetical protein A3E93_03140 [Candidatus Zambryskibacteria bacterium RIFCSPHIGHO2_12_FULL_43_12b]OHB03013.1 MAG: hypothetical protein A2920_02995 [Candidatus Zambryskibacteria bacterium RIFCSPLOWO2_01_FULL_43_17]